MGLPVPKRVHCAPVIVLEAVLRQGLDPVTNAQQGTGSPLSHNQASQVVQSVTSIAAIRATLLVQDVVMQSATLDTLLTLIQSFALMKCIPVESNILDIGGQLVLQRCLVSSW
jgi:hypothetical protein